MIADDFKLCHEPTREEAPSIARQMLSLLDKGRRWAKNYLWGPANWRGERCEDQAMCILGAFGTAMYGERWMREFGQSTEKLIQKLQSDPAASPIVKLLTDAVAKRTGNTEWGARGIYHWNDGGFRKFDDIEAILTEVAEQEYEAYRKLKLLAENTELKPPAAA